MPTLNQFSNTDFSTNLYLNQLSKPDKSAKVYDLSGGYNVIDLLATRNRPARQIVGADGQFQKPNMGRSQIVAQVATNATSGNNLVLTWTDPNFDLFRTTFTVTDGTVANNLGRVISHGPGTVTLEPGPGIGTWNTAIHFVAGTYALEDAAKRHDVYGMMVIGFKQPLVSGFYILGMALLCLHLSHGALLDVGHHTLLRRCHPVGHGLHGWLLGSRRSKG